MNWHEESVNDDIEISSRYNVSCDGYFFSIAFYPSFDFRYYESILIFVIKYQFNDLEVLNSWAQAETLTKFGLASDYQKMRRYNYALPMIHDKCIFKDRRRYSDIQRCDVVLMVAVVVSSERVLRWTEEASMPYCLVLWTYKSFWRDGKEIPYITLSDTPYKRSSNRRH